MSYLSHQKSSLQKPPIEWQQCCTPYMFHGRVGWMPNVIGIAGSERVATLSTAEAKDVRRGMIGGPPGGSDEENWKKNAAGL